MPRLSTLPNASEVLYESFFTLSIDLLLVAGYDGFFKHVNPAWTQTFGFSQAELMARPFLDFVHPDDRPATVAEVEKLATWAGGETIDRAAVELLAADPVETSAFALTDAWGRRDVGAVLEACELALERARGTRSGEIPRIVGRIAAHVSLVRDCRGLADGGRSAREAASELKKNPYYVQRLYAQAGNFTPPELDDAVVRLAALDAAVKGGSRLPSDFELELALVEITRPAGRSARTAIAAG